MTISPQSFFLDGRTISFRDGESVLEAALRAGVRIPHLCHHPELVPAGRCRLCTVECEGKGIQASCTLQPQPGMKIRSESPEVRKARQVALELLLANHPMDCLNCGKNGRCQLQEVTALIGFDPERLARLREFSSIDPAPALDQGNPFFTRDAERCVLCGICVRTCSELQGVGALSFTGRGDGIELDRTVCESCGECVVRCPTGALVETESRRPTREVKTTCTFCGVGCTMHLGVRGNEIVSARGDYESVVSRGRLCVKGRYGYSFVNSEGRLKTPLVRKGGRRDAELVPASWDEALDLVARKFTEHRGGAFAGISSSRATNEENYLVQKFVRAVMGTNNIDNCARLCHAPTVSGLAKAFGTGGGTNPLFDIHGAKCIFVIGSNATEAHPVAGVRIREAASDARLIVADPRQIELVRHADVWLPLKPGTDVALLMGISKVILDNGWHDASFVSNRCEGFDEFKRALEAFPLEKVSAITEVPADRIEAAARIYAQNAPALLVYSLGITEHSHGTDNVLAIANLAMLTGNVGKPSAGVMPMRGQNNVQGACDMGCIPGHFPGSQPVTNPEVREKFEARWQAALPAEPGLTVVEMLDAALRKEVKAFYIVGMDVAYSVADTHRTQAALRAADFVVVQDIFLTGTAQFADVVLPAASFAEKDGTFTNLERRVQRVRQAIEPVGESKPDWWIVSELARRMGSTGFDYANAAEIMLEMSGLTPSFAGFSMDRLESGGIQWPCYSTEHSGTVRLHAEKFNTPSGLGRFSALEYRPSADSTDSSYPLLLTTGRSIYHFHLAMTSQVKGLMQLHSEELAWLHPQDAAIYGVRDGERIRVSSRRGSLVVRAKVTDLMLPGRMFMTFHFYDQPTNVLTQQALDPVSKTPEFKVTAVRIEPDA